MLEIGIMNKNNISKLADILKKDTYVEFTYNNLFYEIFKTNNSIFSNNFSYYLSFWTFPKTTLYLS